MKRDSWKDYFSFSGKEKFAVIFLVLIMAIFITFSFLHVTKKQPPVVDASLQQQIDQLNQNATANSYSVTDGAEGFHQSDTSLANPFPEKVSLFYFDPNTLEEVGWQNLGIRERTIHTIKNYLSKGGHFYKPEDIYKIYGLSKEQASTLVPYIQISSEKSHQKNFNPAYTSTKNETAATFTSPKKLHLININTATAEEWETMPGIGDILSKRIVKFRNVVHGFKSVGDIRKTYGLSDSVFQILKPYLNMQ